MQVKIYTFCVLQCMRNVLLSVRNFLSVASDYLTECDSEVILMPAVLDKEIKFV